ncbi:MAG: S41 family peptidase [Sedimentibacter sp.]|uniref:S41 family peptidase n=1 Tax=Sedimentibacter sp. TaxID=1960295 RepID=UPI002980A5B8|nr:S41 family peptidase [Sedimentibacter sp.]MDW5300365.1 S41 family peptidase [Sedimentibacter sp.]
MKRKICLMLAVLIMMFSVQPAFAAEFDEEKFIQDVDFMEKVINFVLDKYQYEVSEEDVINGLYDGFFEVLDDYSVYYSPKEYQAMLEDTAGEFSGIGVQIIDSNGQVVVLTPLPNSPAIEAGIKAGDIIKFVDGADITGLNVNEASMLIRGEEGTKVKIGVVRGTENLTFDLIRRTIVTSSVEGSIMEKNIGYLKVTEFSNNTVSLVKQELSKFDANNVKKIVIDMRSNGGGTLDASVDMLNLFVTEGPVVYVDYAATGEEDIYSSELKEQKYEIAVLINEGSASATEIFAGAVKYKNEGVIVGTQSFGKGIVQSLYPLKDGSGVKFTTAEYFSVDRTPVHKIGITPDIVVENEKINLSKFPVFSKTIKPVLGNVSLDVLSAEMILETLGYAVDTPDGVYDKTSFNQIIKFQSDNSLYAYGTIDITTQNALYNALLKHSETGMEDKQLETAINELLK